MQTRTYLSANLRRLRTQLCWTQEMLAHSAQVHPTEVGRIERGLREPRLGTIVRISDALGVSIDDLVRQPATAAAVFEGFDSAT